MSWKKFHGGWVVWSNYSSHLQVQTSWLRDRDWVWKDLGDIWSWPGQGLDWSLTTLQTVKLVYCWWSTVVEVCITKLHYCHHCCLNWWPLNLESHISWSQIRLWYKLHPYYINIVGCARFQCENLRRKLTLKLNMSRYDTNHFIINCIESKEGWRQVFSGSLYKHGCLPHSGREQEPGTIFQIYNISVLN